MQFATVGAGMDFMLNDYEASESTYQCSDFKPTPIATGFVNRQKTDPKLQRDQVAPAYNLRSAATVTTARPGLELPTLTSLKV